MALLKTLDNEDNLSHQQVFGHLDGDLFTASEAAEYLEVSMATFRRYLKAEKLLASTGVGASHLYALDDLRQFKQAERLAYLINGRDHDYDNRSLDVQVSRLRRLLEDDPTRSCYLQTVRGRGYMLTQQQEELA